MYLTTTILLGIPEEGEISERTTMLCPLKITVCTYAARIYYIETGTHSLAELFVYVLSGARSKTGEAEKTPRFHSMQIAKITHCPVAHFYAFPWCFSSASKLCTYAEFLEEG